MESKDSGSNAQKQHKKDYFQLLWKSWKKMHHVFLRGTCRRMSSWKESRGNIGLLIYFDNNASDCMISMMKCRSIAQ